MHSSGFTCIVAAAAMLPLASCVLDAPHPAAGEPSGGIDDLKNLATDPGPPFQVFRRFVNDRSKRCLDAALQSIHRNGTTIQLWDCNGQMQQRWLAPLSGRGEIRNLASDRCLDAALQSIDRNGTLVQLWECNGGDQQLWDVSNPGNIKNVHSGRCLDAALQSINRNGTTMQLWDCNGGSQQFWDADPVVVP
jgi:hypothetical protein